MNTSQKMQPASRLKNLPPMLIRRDLPGRSLSDAPARKEFALTQPVEVIRMLADRLPALRYL